MACLPDETALLAVGHDGCFKLPSGRFDMSLKEGACVQLLQPSVVQKLLRARTRNYSACYDY